MVWIGALIIYGTGVFTGAYLTSQVMNRTIRDLRRANRLANEKNRE